MQGRKKRNIWNGQGVSDGIGIKHLISICYDGIGREKYLVFIWIVKQESVKELFGFVYKKERGQVL